MQLNEKQFEKIAHLLPKQRGNVKIPSLVIINALLYIAENGCKWRALPEKYGYWHTVYMRFDRWVDSGVIDKIFNALHEEASDMPEMTLDEINAEISAARTDRKRG